MPRSKASTFGIARFLGEQSVELDAVARVSSGHRSAAQPATAARTASSAEQPGHGADINQIGPTFAREEEDADGGERSE
jgi:hypothetical protein